MFRKAIQDIPLTPHGGNHRSAMLAIARHLQQVCFGETNDPLVVFSYPGNGIPIVVFSALKFLATDLMPRGIDDDDVIRYDHADLTYGLPDLDQWLQRLQALTQTFINGASEFRGGFLDETEVPFISRGHRILLPAHREFLASLNALPERLALVVGTSYPELIQPPLQDWPRVVYIPPPNAAALEAIMREFLNPDHTSLLSPFLEKPNSESAPLAEKVRAGLETMVDRGYIRGGRLVGPNAGTEAERVLGSGGAAQTPFQEIETYEDARRALINKSNALNAELLSEQEAN